MKGRLIIIEGLDGSGKATQSALLTERLEQAGTPVQKISFPNYKSEASQPVKMYLNGAFGTDPEDVNAYAASSFYAVDRYASYKTEWAPFYLGGGVVISDRYTTSNAVHQCSKLPKEKWDDYLAWLFDFEYNKIAIPTPDLVVYLDMSVEVSQALMQKRYSEAGGKKDIHEKDETYLLKSQQAARYCAEKYGWKRIACDNGNTPYTIAEIAEEVFAVVSQFLNECE